MVNNVLLRVLLVLPLFFGFMTHASALEVPPKPDRLVNDRANVLTAEEEALLEQKLVAYDDSTSTQIAILIVPSLEGDDIFDFSQRVGETWGIGRKGKDNGVLVTVAIEEHKIWIHTGYGVEGALPDALVKRIIDLEITPGFKDGSYYKGLDHGTTAMIQALAGEYKNTESRGSGKKKNYAPFIIALLFIALLAFIPRRIGSRSGHHGYGRSATYYGGGYWGGRSSGGGFGGGGGGGFGGFGGGSFGGGGAGGSW